MCRWSAHQDIPKDATAFASCTCPELALRLRLIETDHPLMDAQASGSSGRIPKPAIPVFLINLDRAEDRLQRFKAHAAEREIAFERFPAIDGAQVAPPVAAKVCANWRPRDWTAPSPGEIGCFLSHVAVWQLIAQRGLDWAFIAEDDIRFSPIAARLFCQGHLPKDIDVVKAETWVEPILLSRAGEAFAPGFTLHRMWSKHVGAGGYFVSARGAHRLIAWAEHSAGPADLQLFDPETRSIPGLTVRQIVPAFCVQSARMWEREDPARMETTIGTSSDRSHFSGQGRCVLLRKIRRELKRAVLSLRSTVLLRAGVAERKTVPFVDTPPL